MATKYKFFGLLAVTIILCGEEPQIHPISAKVEYLFDLGNDRNRVGDYKGAIIAYTKALDLDGKFSDAYAGRGYAKLEIGDYEGAIMDDSKAILLNPLYALAYNNRGNAEQSIGKLDEAIYDYNQAIKIDPKYSVAYNNRGKAKSDKGKYDDAIVDFCIAINLDNQYAHAYFNRGLSKQMKGDYDGSIIDFSLAVQIDGKYGIAFTNLGISKMGKKNWRSAINDLTRAITIDPNLVIAYEYRGIAEDSLDDIQSAIVDYSKAIEIKPEAFAYNARGCDQKADSSSAIADFTMAIKLDPKSVDYLNNRAMRYFNLHQYQEALIDFDNILIMESSGVEMKDYTQMRKWISRCQLNDDSRATEDLKKYINMRQSMDKVNWASSLLNFLACDISEDQLLKMAKASSQEEEAGHYCEAYYYSAMFALIRMDKEHAITLFQKSIATKMEKFQEYGCSEIELGRIAKNSFHSPRFFNLRQPM